MTLTYAIGDIHSHAAMLDALLLAIEAHRAGRSRQLVFLGDYINRGPDAAGVVRRVRALQEAEPKAVVCLGGNHDATIALAPRNEDNLGIFLANGGDHSLTTWGAATIDDVPEDVITWFAGLPTIYEDAQRIYVHAGLPIGVPVEQTHARHHRWTRGTFLTVDHDFGRHVVHGHTPQDGGLPELRPYRTNLDTASAFGGPLTAGVFTDAQGPPVAYLQALPGGQLREVRLP